MPAATHEPTTSTRRSAMRFSLAAALGGLAVPALAAPQSNPDAELIRLCDRLVALESAGLRLYETVEDDDERDVLFRPIDAERRRLTPVVEDLGNPKTLEGARAMARVALAYLPLNLNGDREIGHDPEDWFFACVAEFLTGDMA